MALVTIDHDSDVAPYEQIRVAVATMVAKGQLPAGQQLPTVRRLAADLGLAVNTVARSYRELEADGVISTFGRRGTFVRSTFLDETSGPADLGSSQQQATAAAERFAAVARGLGLTLSESARLLESAWRRS